MSKRSTTVQRPLLDPERAKEREWRRLYRRLEGRVGLDTDTETRRFQKVMVVVAAVVGSLATVFNATALFQVGLTLGGWAYVLSAIILMAGGLALLFWPRFYVVIVWVLLLDVLAGTAVAQFASGGLTSGLLAVPWTIFAPLGAALALGSRHTAAHLSLFLVLLVTLAAIDPQARSLAPDVRSEDFLLFNLGSLVSLGVMAGAISLYLLRQLEGFRAAADSLLLNVLPRSIADRLKAEETTIADRFEHVTVLFADIVGFTPLSSGLDPEVIVAMLNSVFSEFDDLAKRHGIQKIKTIGDAYMAAAGLPGSAESHVAAVLAFALDMLDVTRAHEGLDGSHIDMRIGIDTGAVVAGVIGHDRFIYDLWGDTVNIASRMETTGLPNVIHVTDAVRRGAGDLYVFESRGPIEVKGKGLIESYILVRPDAGESSQNFSR